MAIVELSVAVIFALAIATPIAFRHSKPEAEPVEYRLGLLATIAIASFLLGLYWLFRYSLILSSLNR